MGVTRTGHTTENASFVHLFLAVARSLTKVINFCERMHFDRNDAANQNEQIWSRVLLIIRSLKN